MSIMIEELFSQIRLRLRRLSHHKQSTGILVDAMNQSNLRVVRIIARQITQMPGDGVNQRAVEVSTTRMHYHTSRFIDNHQIVVFITHIQWDILGFNSRIEMWAIQHQSDDIPRAHLIVAFYWTVVYKQEACIGSLLNTIT